MKRIDCKWYHVVLVFLPATDREAVNEAFYFEAQNHHSGGEREPDPNLWGCGSFHLPPPKPKMK